MATVILGGSGRLGSRVCAGLVQKKILVRSLQRQLPSVPVPGIEYFAGDVSNITALCEAMRGCDSVICVHGVKPLRFSKPTDLVLKPSSDSSHPYNVNYIGVCNVLKAMKLESVRKIVRITGGLIGKGELNLFKALFNLLLSFTVKWHEQSEIAIRASGLDYTILRPTELIDSPPARQSNRSLILSQDFTSSKPSFISLDDVADLCIRAAVDEDTMPFATALCSSRAGGDGAQTWTPLLQKVISFDTPV